jgi:hypothetical protein
VRFELLRRSGSARNNGLMRDNQQLIQQIDAALDAYGNTKAWRGPMQRAELAEHVRACVPIARALGLADVGVLEQVETAPLVQVVSALQRMRRGLVPNPAVVTTLPPLRPRPSRYRPGCWRRFL